MWLWLIIAVVLLGVGTYSMGRFDLDNADPTGTFWLIFIGSLVWPLVLTAAVIIGPFFGLFWLGDRKREKLKKEKSTDNK